MENEYQDKLLVCRECGSEFVFSSREQDFYAQKGFDHEPTRCQQCRNERRRDRTPQPNAATPIHNYPHQQSYPAYQVMPGNYAPPRSAQPMRTGGISNGQRTNSYGNRQFGPNYSTLGRNTVGNSYHTRPNGYSQPNSYGNQLQRPINNGYNQPAQFNTNLAERKMYPIVCNSCGVSTEVPFVPREGAPVFCRTCYNSQKNNR